MVKIIFTQDISKESGSLKGFGVSDCFFKKLSLDCDGGIITPKTHYHRGFEMHIVTEGHQEYCVDGETYNLKSGDFLLIYPDTPHTALSFAPQTQKCSINFNKTIEGDFLKCFFGRCTSRMCDNINSILSENELKKEISSTLIENNILETIVIALRLAGEKEEAVEGKRKENQILHLAKKYIEDNIRMSPTVGDVTEYCHLSAKQLTRIFNRYEGVSPGKYIIKKQVAEIENLIKDQTLSLKEISSEMNFDNEYYFNTFFKKHSGLPPGEYRKMIAENHN